MSPDSLMLFAAGFGTRMGPLTETRPKPLIEVAGRPLIDHALALARAGGARRIVANLHYRGEMLAEHLAGRDVALSWERPEILDTGGGLRAALPLLGPGPVFTLNTDAAWSGPDPLGLLRAAWDPGRMDALLLCVPREAALGHTGTGDFAADAEGRARRGGNLVYTGLQIIEPSGLAEVPQGVFSLNLPWSLMEQRGRLHALVWPGRWCDVGRPECIALAGAMLREPRDV